MKINIQAIIRWEQLLKLPFSKFNTLEDDHLITLVYTTNNIRIKLSTFKDISSSKAFTQLLKETIVELEYISQFHEQDSIKNGTEESHTKISEVIYQLIASGLDANYLMNSSLIDLPHIIQAYEKYRVEQMEESRLWTFLNIRPHITGKLSPIDIIEFPWETELLEKQKQAKIDESLKLAPSFLNKTSKNE